MIEDVEQTVRSERNMYWRIINELSGFLVDDLSGLSDESTAALTKVRFEGYAKWEDDNPTAWPTDHPAWEEMTANEFFA